MKAEVDLRLFSLGLAIWVGTASKGLLHSYWLLVLPPLFLLMGKKFGSLFLIAA